MYPGKPLANVAFKTYGYISMAQALSFVSDFKLGHYMKIPPRSMFIVQVFGKSELLGVGYFSYSLILFPISSQFCDISLLEQ